MSAAREAVMGAASAYWLSRCIHVVADLGVADAIGDQPESADTVATKVGANADALRRVLRFVSAHGIFETRDDGRVGHNEASRLLRSDHPGSLRAFTRFIGGPLEWGAFTELEHSVRTGVPSVQKVATSGLFEWLGSNPEHAKVFDEAMTSKSHGHTPGLLAACEFARFKTIADIGGGRGHLLVAALKSAANAKGILFDLPHVIKEAAPIASDRLELKAGDFFKDGLPKADAYILMEVIHDWADKESVAILSAVRAAAPPNAKVLVLELVVPAEPAPHLAKAMDINMLVMTGGRERTQGEYAALLSASGLKLDRVVPTPTGLCMIEASPV